VIRARPLMILLALATAACGSSQPAELPKGFTALDGPEYTLGYPSDWKRLEVGGGQGAQGRAGTGGLAPQAAVGRGAASANLDQTVEGFKTDQRVRRSGWKVVKEEPYHLDGAKGAKLIEATYREVSGASPTPVRTIDVLVQTDKGVALDLFLRAPDADFDRARLREVLDTFRLQ